MHSYQRIFLGLALAVAAVAAVSVKAVAADMPVKAPYTVPVAADSWVGFYVGIHGGEAWSRQAVSISDLSIADLKPSGGLFGAHAGYLWQYQGLVGGFEIDYSHLGFTEQQNIVVGGEETNLAAGVHIRDLASARARVGITIMPSLLAYGTAGVGWGNIEQFVTNGTQSVSSASSAFGWVAGGGLEWQILQHFRLRGEFLHYDLGQTNTALATIASNPTRFHVDVARAALSWRFN